MSGCACSTAPTLIFPCSGGSDCGAVADQAARQLTRDGVGRMYCLAGIGGAVPAILANARAAGRTLAIDGCDLDCAKRTLEREGLPVDAHVRLSDLGMRKGSTPVDAATTATVAEHGRRALAPKG